MNSESKLESLRLLFSPGFDDDDLLSILEEAQDDLDLAIARISEGQTATWEQRKPKIKNTFKRGGNLQREGKVPPEKIKEKNYKKKKSEKKDKTLQSLKGTQDQIQQERADSQIPKKEEKKVFTKNSLVVTLSKQAPKEKSMEKSMEKLEQDSTLKLSTGAGNNLPPGLLSGSQSINGKKTLSKQLEAVVMPQNPHMPSLGVQFGSLKIGKEEKNLAEKVAVLDSKRIKTPLKTEAAPQNANAPAGVDMMQYQSMMNYFQQIPGFGMMPGNGEFQQVYGADGVQGYYSSPYAKFPSGSQNTLATSAAGTSQTLAASSQNPQQMGIHQQQFAMPFGYYPYYMPGQYQNAPGAHPTYGTQFVNKNVYHYGPSVSGASAVSASLTTSALPASNTQTLRNSNAPATSTAYPFVSASAAPLYGNYDESLGFSGSPNGNIPFQNFNSGFANQSNNSHSQSNTTKTRSSTSGSNPSGQHFSNQRPAYDKFSKGVTAQSTNESYYNPDQQTFGNQYQQHHQQPYYLQHQQHQQPQQVVYGGYNNGRSSQQYWTTTANGGQ